MKSKYFLSILFFVSIFFFSCKKESNNTNSTISKSASVNNVLGNYFVRYHSYEGYSYYDSNGVYHDITYTYPADTAFIDITLNKGNNDTSLMFSNINYSCDSVNNNYLHFSADQFNTISILSDSIYIINFWPSPRTPFGKIWEGKKR